MIDVVALARLWQQRLGIADWPASIRSDPKALIARISTGVVDVIVMPAVAGEIEIVETMLLYAFHNVPEDRKPARSDVWGIACDLVKGWSDETSSEDHPAAGTQAAALNSACTPSENGPFHEIRHRDTADHSAESHYDARTVI